MSVYNKMTLVDVIDKRDRHRNSISLLKRECDIYCDALKSCSEDRFSPLRQFIVSKLAENLTSEQLDEIDKMHEEEKKRERNSVYCDRTNDAFDPRTDDFEIAHLRKTEDGKIVIVVESIKNRTWLIAGAYWVPKFFETIPFDEAELNNFPIEIEGI